MIGFLDLCGLINARVVSMDRYGKTREIRNSLPEETLIGLFNSS
jgi:cell division control protein 6